MKITVNPYRPVLPRGSRNALLPDAPRAGGNVTGHDYGEQRVDVVPERFQGNATVRIGRRLAGCLAMQRPEEFREAVGRPVAANGSVVGRFALNPSHDSPVLGET